ncbi:hypothetical protein EGW08_015831 [Elysia chlorotica]|uniref:Large ribosomal subunit protein mL52 n=1 Tax=Elysia chlorotica TaxID=188477 RepID=A0A433T4E3_ELYCH|nr:hypothetical protein EGW08_015831 [Elysia chlorotica]
MAASIRLQFLTAHRKVYNLTCLRAAQEKWRHTLPAASSITSCSFHTSSSHEKDRRKDRAVSQYLYYRDHEKTMRHRNLPLLDLPDYSYTDGRPTELSLSQARRQEKNYELAKHIVQLVGEMKQAENLHREQQEAEVTRQRQRLDSRLREKKTQFKE